MKASWLKCFFFVAWREVIVFSKGLRSKLIDLFIIVSMTLFVFYFLMPHLGTPENYGLFIFIGLIPLLTLFDIIVRVSLFIADIAGSRKISYLLTLPMPSWMIFMAIGVGWASCTALFTIFVLPIGKALLWEKFEIARISFWRFFIIFFSLHLFYSFFSLWLAGLIKDLKYVSWIWSRVVNPMFSFGCYFYSWHVVYQAAPMIGIVNLLNPVIYTMEGIRAAVFGQEGFLSFGICVAVLWFFIVIFLFHATYLLKKRLDCV